MIYGNLGDLELIEYGENEKISKTFHFFQNYRTDTSMHNLHLQFTILRIKIITLNELLK